MGCRFGVLEMQTGINCLIDRLTNKDGRFFGSNGVVCNVGEIEFDGTKCGWLVESTVYGFEIRMGVSLVYYKREAGCLEGTSDEWTLFMSKGGRIMTMLLALDDADTLMFMFEDASGAIICERFDRQLNHVGHEVL